MHIWSAAFTCKLKEQRAASACSTPCWLSPFFVAIVCAPRIALHRYGWSSRCGRWKLGRPSCAPWRCACSLGQADQQICCAALHTVFNHVWVCRQPGCFSVAWTLQRVATMLNRLPHVTTVGLQPGCMCAAGAAGRLSPRRCTSASSWPPMRSGACSSWRRGSQVRQLVAASQSRQLFVFHGCRTPGCARCTGGASAALALTLPAPLSPTCPPRVPCLLCSQGAGAGGPAGGAAGCPHRGRPQAGRSEPAPAGRGRAGAGVGGAPGPAHCAGAGWGVEGWRGLRRAVQRQDSCSADCCLKARSITPLSSWHVATNSHQFARCPPAPQVEPADAELEQRQAAGHSWPAAAHNMQKDHR